MDHLAKCKLLVHRHRMYAPTYSAQNVQLLQAYVTACSCPQQRQQLVRQGNSITWGVDQPPHQTSRQSESAKQMQAPSAASSDRSSVRTKETAAAPTPGAATPRSNPQPQCYLSAAAHLPAGAGIPGGAAPRRGVTCTSNTQDGNSAQTCARRARRSTHHRSPNGGFGNTGSAHEQGNDKKANRPGKAAPQKPPLARARRPAPDQEAQPSALPRKGAASAQQTRMASPTERRERDPTSIPGPGGACGPGVDPQPRHAGADKSAAPRTAGIGRRTCGAAANDVPARTGAPRARRPPEPPRKFILRVGGGKIAVRRHCAQHRRPLQVPGGHVRCAGAAGGVGPEGC